MGSSAERSPLSLLCGTWGRHRGDSSQQTGFAMQLLIYRPRLTGSANQGHRDAMLEARDLINECFCAGHTRLCARAELAALHAVFPHHANHSLILGPSRGVYPENSSRYRREYSRTGLWRKAMVARSPRLGSLCCGKCRTAGIHQSFETLAMSLPNLLPTRMWTNTVLLTNLTCYPALLYSGAPLQAHDRFHSMGLFTISQIESRTILMLLMPYYRPYCFCATIR